MIEAMDTAELSGKLAEEIVELEQKEREAQLAFKLRERLSQFVDGTEEERAEWQKAMAAKAQALCKHAFGDAMVEAIGWTYENYSTQFLGKQNNNAKRSYFYCTPNLSLVFCSC